MFIPVLAFLIVLGAFSAEKLLLCSTSTSLVNKRKQMKITSEETRKFETQLSSKKQEEQTNKQSWLRKERKKERETLPAEVGTSA